MSPSLAQPLNDAVLSNQELHFMKNLQANILKGHGREHVVLVLLEILDTDKARVFLHDYPATDSLTQLRETKRFKDSRVPGGLVRLVFLTRAGLEVFGRGELFPTLTSMATDVDVLDDGTTASWQQELRKPVHVMLLVAYHNEHDLLQVVGKMVADFEASDSPFNVVFVQEGRAYKNLDGEGIEQFGYVDGRSQPLMIQSAIDEEKEKHGGIDVYDPSASLGQFVVPDPLDTAGFGSFFVFRKLEQNVAGFKAAEKEIASLLSLATEDAERAGAQVVGRFEDGTPLTLKAAEGGVPVANNFDYARDVDGAKCPFHAHIRKSNPRGSSPGGLDFDKGVQMARRGITYGSRLQDPSTKEFIDKPNDGVGLLFMSYQASLDDQFRFMQTAWVNSSPFPQINHPGDPNPEPARTVGIDPVIGQRNAVGDNLQAQTWSRVYGNTFGSAPRLFEGFVTLKGGEYFFAPSIPGLRAL